MDVEAGGSSFMRLWFSALPSPGGTAGGGAAEREVHLFLSDAQDGQNEECYLFKIRLSG